VNKHDFPIVLQEIKHVESYLMLQQERYGERLLATIELEEKIEDIFIPKIAIQTLVDNSIKHGLEQINEPLLISINGYSKDNHVIFSVTDNGPGINGSRILGIMKLLDDDNWISIEKRKWD
jgi:two-component system, sensor histidine kinase YesM